MSSSALYVALALSIGAGPDTPFTPADDLPGESILSAPVSQRTQSRPTIRITHAEVADADDFIDRDDWDDDDDHLVPVYPGPQADDYEEAKLPSGDPVYHDAHFGGGYAAPTYSYESPEPWLHGYFREVPAYHGFKHFRPYNYRQLYAQSRTAIGWRFPSQLPYSHHYWLNSGSPGHCPTGPIVPTYPPAAAPKANWENGRLDLEHTDPIHKTAVERGMDGTSTHAHHRYLPGTEPQPVDRALYKPDARRSKIAEFPRIHPLRQ